MTDSAATKALAEIKAAGFDVAEWSVIGGLPVYDLDDVLVPDVEKWICRGRYKGRAFYTENEFTREFLSLGKSEFVASFLSGSVIEFLGRDEQ